MSKRSLATIAVVAMSVTAFGLITPSAQATHSGTVFVDGSDTTPDAPDCGDKQNPCDTIQAGVDHASDGDVVRVAPATYVEQVEVNRSISLEGQDAPVIQAPASPTNYTLPETGSSWEPVVFLVGGTVTGSTVTGPETIEADITGFVIDGADRDPSDRSAGILVRNVLPGAVTQNVVRNMHVGGGETYGISVYGDTDVTIAKNDVSEYSRVGIVANGDAGDGADPTATVRHNIATGPGTTDPGDWAPNGIQLGYGAGGTVASNVVTDHGFSGGAASSGIIIFGAADGAEIRNNELSRNEMSILVTDDYLFGSGFLSDDAVVEGNRILDTVEEEAGIRVDGAAGVKISANQVNGAGENGIQLGFSASSALVAGNKVMDSADTGIRATSSTSGNDFRGNEVSGSGELSCHDSSGDNSWKGNKGEAESIPAAICR